MLSDNPAIDRAVRSVRAAQQHANSDSARPVCHFRPPANWMNDPNGVIYHQGVYHLFYQHNPYADTWGEIHWGHARSVDLVRWEHLPIALWPSQELGEEHCFSGCACLNGDGQPMLFYTSVGPGEGEQRPHNTQWAALGDDEWLTWCKHPANPILSLETHGGPAFEGDWRDPFIFEEERRTFLVLGGAFDDTAAVALYEAADSDLARWHYRTLLYEQPRSMTRFFECPNFFKVNDTWVLLTSPYRPVEYVTGAFDLDSLTFSAEQHGILDAGQDATTSANYYATNILFDATGRCILLGWVRGFPPGRGWNGCLALPRVLTVGADGQPRQAPVPELQQLRGRNTALRHLDLNPASPQSQELESDTFELLAELALGSASQFKLEIAATNDDMAPLEVTFNGTHLNVAGTEVALPSTENGTLKIHLFVDKSVLEIFANDGLAAITRVIPYLGPSAKLVMSTLGGTVRIRSLDIWEIQPIW